MSFAREVKLEVLDNEIKNECCKLAFLSSVIHSIGELRKTGQDVYVQLKTDMKELFNVVNSCLASFYSCTSTIEKDEENNVNKTTRYIITFPKEITKRVLFDTGLMSYNFEDEYSLNYGISPHIFESDCCKKTFIKGVFVSSSTSNILIGESKNHPRTFSGYHWEFDFVDERFADDFSTLLFSLGITHKKSKRKSLTILYIKEAEVVSDLFATVGAYKGLLELQNEMAVREVRNNINRQNNCLNANITKTVNASLKQISAISKIERTIGFEALPQNLRELCLVRLANPEESLDNLTKLLSTTITKSGINHQFNRLIKIANNIDEDKDT